MYIICLCNGGSWDFCFDLLFTLFDKVSFTDNSKINFKIVSRPAGSKELTVYESINQLRDIIEKDGLKINNSNDDNHIAVINSISVYEKNDKTEIPLDNSNYNSHFDWLFNWLFNWLFDWMIYLKK